ncbi:MAG: acyltransferase domain-containing protein [Candidatus Latescibacterota bacterium]|nr:acyltransferase domain-containing protein [Candidatus Latescibacterota bacterium]
MTFTIDSLTNTGLENGWIESASCFPAGGPRFLEPNYIQEAASWTELPGEAVADCLEAANIILHDVGLQKLSWHVHRRLFVVISEPTKAQNWPSAIPGLHNLSGAFYLLQALSGITSMLANHKQRGIPTEVSRLNCRDIHIWAREYKTLGEPRQHGFAHEFDPPRWGLHIRGLSWIGRSLRGVILRIGRLQFIHAPYSFPYLAFRHVQSGKVQVLSEKGNRFTDDGWKAKKEDEEAWQSDYTELDGKVTATPITADGRAHKTPTRLDLKEWKPVLLPGDPVLEIHIPEDGPMDFDACGESLVEMIRGFPTYFAGESFSAFVCESWLLDPQFQDRMRETSNICRFQRECYLYPIGPGSGRSGLLRLFTSDDIPSLPRDTNMRQAYLNLFDSGGLWRGGGMMLFPNDLDWGRQVYLQAHRRESREQRAENR